MLPMSTFLSKLDIVLPRMFLIFFTNYMHDAYVLKNQYHDVTKFLEINKGVVGLSVKSR